MTTQLNPNLDFSMTLPPQINLLVNGGFEQWQRGSGPFSNPAIAAYTADKWQANYGGGPTFSITKETSIVQSEATSLKLDITVVGSGTSAAIFQDLENARSYRGKIVTVSVAMKCNVPNAAIIYLTDGFSSWISSYHTGDNTWQILTVSALVGAVATAFRVTLGLPTSCFVSTTYIDSAMMTVSPGLINFIPLHPANELVRCQRYYENGFLATFIPIYRNATPGNEVITWVPFNTKKAAVPTNTVTIVSAVRAHSPTTGAGNGGADGANWSNQTANPTVSGFSLDSSRSTDQTTYPILSIQFNWTAEVT